MPRFAKEEGEVGSPKPPRCIDDGEWIGTNGCIRYFMRHERRT